MIAPFSEELLKDESVTILHDLEPESDIVLISFSGVGIGLGVPFFEFKKVVDPHRIKKIFVRDLYKSWYHAGLKGLAESIDESIPVLKELIADSGARKVLTMGNSMGGYAAILYGILLEADEVMAFAPTTFANWKNRLRYLDLRSHYQYLKNAPVKPYHYYDLRQVPGLEKPIINIYFDTDYWSDRNHARHLARGHDNVRLHPYHGSKHHMIKKLKDSGELEKVITTTIERLQNA